MEFITLYADIVVQIKKKEVSNGNICFLIPLIDTILESTIRSNEGCFAVCTSPRSLVQHVTLDHREKSYRSQGTSKAFLIYDSLIILRNAMAKAAASRVWMRGQRL